MKKKLLSLMPAAALFIYFIWNLITLMKFPAVHSDELWLKGITDEMIRQKSFAVTEPFFDLYPRVVHPFRLLFHSIQALFFLVFGSSVWTARLLSLVFSTAGLVVFFHVLKKSTGHRLMALAGTGALALNLQFLYGARFARQDTLILLLLLIAYELAVHSGLSQKRLPQALALVTFLGMLVHPNSFLIGLLCFLLLLWRAAQKDGTWKTPLSYALFTAGGFVLTYLLGTLLNPGFLDGYLKFGESLGIEATPMGRLEGFYWFWVKLYRQIGGTYELLNIRMELLLFFFLMLLLPWLTIKSRKSPQHFQLLAPWTGLFGISLGLLLIGRYNQTSVVFLLPFILLGLMAALSKIFEICRWKGLTAVTVLFLLFFPSVKLQKDLQVYRSTKPYVLSYEAMIHEIDAAVPENASVLSNLNTLEAFQDQHFYDIRNLAFLKDRNLSLQEYLQERGITYILLHEEMSYILQTQPTWDFLYGTGPYLEELFQYLETSTELVYEFENPLYAMRIARYSGTYPWKTKIYRVKP